MLATRTNRNPQQGQLPGPALGDYQVMDIAFEDQWLIDGDCGTELMSNKSGSVQTDIHQVEFSDGTSSSGVSRDCRKF